MCSTEFNKKPEFKQEATLEPLHLRGFHPKLQEALQLCPNNEDQVKLAFQMYMDLCEAKAWNNVELHHCKDLNIMFVTARHGTGQPRNIFVTCDVNEEMSPADMQSYFQHIKIPNKEIDSITLGMCDEDTSIVYYKLSNDLRPPDPPELSEAKKRNRRQRNQQKRQHLYKQTELYRTERDNVPESENTLPDDNNPK